MRVALPNTDEINEKNVVNAVKQVIHALEQEADLYGHHDTVLTEEVRELKNETRVGFEKVSEDIQTLTSDIDNGFGHLSNEFKEEIGGLRSEFKEEIGGLRSEFKEEIGGLRSEFKEEIGGLRKEMKESQSQMVDLLKMIAENTKK